MLDNLINWSTAAIVVVSILTTYTGVKVINKLFEKPIIKKNNSLF